MKTLFMSWFAWGAVACWAIAFVLYLIPKTRDRYAPAMSILGVACGAALLTYLWITLGRPPMRTLGETRWWYAVLVPTMALLIGWRFRTHALAFPSLPMAIAFAMFNLLNPEFMDRTLMPALQSPWFIPHVVVYIVGYAALGISSMLAAWVIAKRLFLKRAIVPRDVDLPHTMVMVGFPLLSAGLLFGAVWGKVAWGHYWTWDPKETWAALTWVAYLVFLHLKVKHPLKPTISLAFLLVGFGVLMMTWFGVNYLPSAQESMHTYTMN